MDQLSLAQWIWWLWPRLLKVAWNTKQKDGFLQKRFELSTFKKLELTELTKSYEVRWHWNCCNCPIFLEWWFVGQNARYIQISIPWAFFIWGEFRWRSTNEGRMARVVCSTLPSWPVPKIPVNLCTKELEISMISRKHHETKHLQICIQFFQVFGRALWKNVELFQKLLRYHPCPRKIGNPLAKNEPIGQWRWCFSWPILRLTSFWHLGPSSTRRPRHMLKPWAASGDLSRKNEAPAGDIGWYILVEPCGQGWVTCNCVSMPTMESWNPYRRPRPADSEGQSLCGDLSFWMPPSV